MVASVVGEEQLALDDVMRILDEASQLRAYSHALEEKSQSLERATAELRAANEQSKSLDRLKDDFMSSVTHEPRMPLTSIRALAELMQDDADMDAAQRQQFLGIVVTETKGTTAPSRRSSASARPPTSTFTCTAWCWTGCIGAAPMERQPSSRLARPAATSCTSCCRPSSLG